MILAFVGIVPSVACERSQEAVAIRVVTDWVTDNADTAADEIAQLVIGEFPDLMRLPEDQVEHKIKDAYSWSFKPPECGSNIRCDVTAIASVIFSVTCRRWERTYCVAASTARGHARPTVSADAAPPSILEQRVARARRSCEDCSQGFRGYHYYQLPPLSVK